MVRSAPRLADRQGTARHHSRANTTTVMGRNTTAPVATKEPREAAAETWGAPGPAADALRTQLHEKEQLVAALTQRLEQAAEQLDRFRRTGVDKGRRPLTGDAAGSSSGEQRQAFDDLKRLVGDWDAAQPGAALGRIEAGVNELRELVSQALASGVTAAPAGSTPREKPASAALASSSPSAHAAGSGAKAAPTSWWERQKAAMLGEGPAEESSPAADGAATAPPASDSSAETQDAAAPSVVRLEELDVPEPPPAVDFESLTLEEAKSAIRERDRLIERLREPLLLLKAAAQLPSDLQSLEHLPPALRERVEELESQWQARFRQAELDLSLERARLAREESQLRHQQELLQKQQKHGGKHAKHAPDGPEGENGAAGRRWFRFMGKTADEAEEGPSGDET